MTHTFDTDHATLYGIEEAILIQNLWFWIKKNNVNGRHIYEGRTWTYNSVKAFNDLFPYMSQKTVRRALKNLIDAGILITGNFNKNPTDRTLWYAFNDESKFKIKEMDLPNRENGIAYLGNSYTDNKPTDSKPDEIDTSELRFKDKINADLLVIGDLNGIKDFYGIRGKARWTKERSAMIKARLKDWNGENPREEIRAMMEHRCKVWKGTEWEKFIRIETLFQPKKFFGYMEEAEAQPDKDWTEQRSGDQDSNTSSIGNIW